MPTAQELYTDQVKTLPASEQLRLAKMILNGLATADVDYSDEWSEQDIEDMAIFSARYASESLGED